MGSNCGARMFWAILSIYSPNERGGGGGGGGSGGQNPRARASMGPGPLEPRPLLVTRHALSGLVVVAN